MKESGYSNQNKWGTPQQQQAHLTPRSWSLMPFSKEPGLLGEMADSRFGAGNIKMILENHEVPENKKVLKSKKLPTLMGQGQRDIGANWKSSREPKLEQREQ